MRDSNKPRVLILNQFYVPDVASTGHLLHELATDLVRRGFFVEVDTSRPCYGPRETWQPVELREWRDGVYVRRLITTRFSKDRLPGRILNFLTFMVPLTLRMLFLSRADTVHLYTTNPPFLGIIGALVSMVRRHRYVKLLHDAYPEMAVWVGTIRKRGVIERVWHLVNKLIYRRAEHTIVLCESAKRLVVSNYGIDPSRVHVIYNWADARELTAKPKSESNFARTHGLIEPFTVMYSGNLGLYYDFETLLGAAERLKNENFRLVLVGAGGRKTWIEEQIAKRGLKNTIVLPYQPFEKLPDSLTACDASLVTIAKGVEGISFPSKLYSSLAVGRPIIAISEERSELRELVDEHDVGMWFKVGDAQGLAEGIRALMSDPGMTQRKGRNARALFERDFTLEAAGEKYAKVLLAAAPPGTPAPVGQDDRQGVPAT
ncbi:MAG: glycosyltransferase family 4 protein [Planctomycetes bacterium]|nr:glycosyltransferase family 4 protein [Planctomycetota bacterium]